MLVVGGLFLTPYVAPNWAARCSWSGAPALHYLVPDVLIAGVIAYRCRGSTLRHLGLAVPARALVSAIGLFAVGLLVSGALFDVAARRSGLEILGRDPLYSLSQVLHQEIVLRSLLLQALGSWLPGRIDRAIVGAFVFAVLHAILFGWVFAVGTAPTTFATLLCFGFAGNLLFLSAGHLAYSFALHAAWNVMRFGRAYLAWGADLSEPETFLLVEGSPSVLLAAVMIVLATWLCCHHASRRAEPDSSRS